MYTGITYPRSNAGRDNAMTIGFNRYNSTADPLKRAITSITYDEIDVRKGPYHLARLDEMGKNAAYHLAVIEADKQVNYLHDLESECIQIFNLGIKRSINPLYKKSDRSYFGLPIETGRQPKLTMEAEIMSFALVIYEGNILRMLVPGATVMLVATPTEIHAQMLVAQAAINARNVAKEAMDTADHLLDTMNVDVDLLILKMWKEIEAFYAKEEEATMRNSSRDWGVIYVSYGSGSDITFTVLDFDDHTVLEDVEGQVNENGDKAVSDAAGILPLRTTVVGAATVTFKKNPLYQELEFPLTIVDESTVAYTVYMKKLV